MKKPINDMEELNRKIGSIELEKNALMKENDKLREQLENIDRDNKNKVGIGTILNKVLYCTVLHKINF
jgi:regulator of replication initiation timing